MSFDAAQKAAELCSEIGPGLKICVLGGTSFQGADSEELTKQVAKQLSRDFPSAVFVTGGLAGVQETFARSCYDPSRVVNLVPHGDKCAFKGVGRTRFAGDDMTQCKAVLVALGDVYITVEGGPGVAQEARIAFSRGAAVVPLVRTGAASAGMFDFPAGALEKPAFASQEHWALLSRDCSVTSTARAVVALVAGFLTSKRTRTHSLPLSCSTADRQEKARLDHLAPPHRQNFGPEDSVRPLQSAEIDLEVWSQTAGMWIPVVSAEESLVSEGQLTVTFYLEGVADGQSLCRKTLSRGSQDLRRIQKPGSEANNADDMTELSEADPDWGWFSRSKPSRVAPAPIEYNPPPRGPDMMDVFADEWKAMYGTSIYNDLGPGSAFFC